MKISMISEHASPLASLGSVDAGGQNSHVAALSQALGELGNEVTVFTRKDRDGLPDAVAYSDRVTVVHIEAGPTSYVPKDDLLPYMDDFGLGIAEFWGQHPHSVPDIVHSHFWMSGLAARVALDHAGLDAPLAHTFHALGTVKRRHQGVLDTSPEERAHLEPQVGHDADVIIATSVAETRELEAMGIDPAATVVIPGGVDLRRFRPDHEREDTRERRRIVMVGRLVARKGIDLTISALVHLIRRGYTDVELHIVGGSAAGIDVKKDPEANRLREVAEELGVSDKVVLRGQLPQEEIPAILRSASVVACTPWYEPFSIVPLEAMACGVPVVAAKVGGLIDTVVDEFTGLHVPPHAPEAIATAISIILDDPYLAEVMGQNSIRRARELFAWPEVARSTEDTYQRLVDPDWDGFADVIELPPTAWELHPSRGIDMAKYDRIERARHRDRNLSDADLKARMAERIRQARSRQLNRAGDDHNVRSLPL